ncbi:hypothetical protein J4216_04510 [Candidatus Woesearchaeota archaeon]|nr:hypothetical protein [Candidatus Woesearchaeota archaeon]
MLNKKVLIVFVSILLLGLIFTIGCVKEKVSDKLEDREAGEPGLVSDGNKEHVKEIYVLVNNGINRNGELFIYNGLLLDSEVRAGNNLIHNDLLICQANLGRDSKRLAVSPDGTKVYITNSEDNTISVINTEDCSLNNLITITRGSPHPRDIKADSQYIYVTTQQGFDRINIDTSDRVQVVLPTGGAKELYLSQNTLYLIDEEGETITANTRNIGSPNLNTVISGGTTDPRYRNIVPYPPSRFGPSPGRIGLGPLGKVYYASKIDGLVWDITQNGNYLRLNNGQYRNLANSQQFTVDQLHSSRTATLIGDSPEDIVYTTVEGNELVFISRGTANQITFFVTNPHFLARPLSLRHTIGLGTHSSPTDLAVGENFLYFLTNTLGVIEIDSSIEGGVALYNNRLSIPGGTPVAMEVFIGDRDVNQEVVEANPETLNERNEVIEEPREAGKKGKLEGKE